MTPGELVRAKVLALLMDPVNGLNPQFTAGCRLRNIEVPTPPNGDPLAPFSFTPNSANVFVFPNDIAWLEKNNVAFVYPLLMWSAGKEMQNRDRLKQQRFFGSVTVTTRAYFAWDVNNPPAGNDYESTLDAFWDAILNCFNDTTAKWAPLLYENRVDLTDRSALQEASDGRLVRRGLTISLTVNVVA